MTKEEHLALVAKLKQIGNLRKQYNPDQMTDDELMKFATEFYDLITGKTKKESDLIQILMPSKWRSIADDAFDQLRQRGYTDADIAQHT